jgi:hypothetical protein
MKERTLKRASADKAITGEHYLGRFSGNPHAVKNVNAPMGPRQGNEGAHEAKRGNFRDEKASRAPLAEQVLSAFAGRARELEANPGEHETPESGAIDSNSQIRRFAAKKNRNRD